MCTTGVGYGGGTARAFWKLSICNLGKGRVGFVYQQQAVGSMYLDGQTDGYRLCVILYSIVLIILKLVRYIRYSCECVVMINQWQAIGSIL